MSSTTEGRPHDVEIEVDEGRRDFIHLLAGGTAAAAVVGVAIPVITQLAPDAAVRALATKEVDIGAVEAGQAIKVVWQGKPVFIRHLTERELNEDEETPISALKDSESRNDAMPGEATVENRLQQNNFVIVLGVCTHLGCVPLGTDSGDNRGDYGGWFCPCHGSHYDSLGRIRKGPAPQNLAVPPLEFLSDTNIRLG
ncbi:ubiquinol-cytochrome c reductase iron-sulfur subunit [Parvularcula dongshanensis]|uniref:Ubiquinol-cytochrome c reductase iron-sulfur subunit n=1 Tax=Parvularcula dongshanensis TaxID=1173995 RepID=A0A840I471_9PROT|nr:ubiquinol-cytochrome c reductase iron-sulfur subunit [Parvularcula dongshanensis]MBB4659786.1 ubiquinol-cytochrome c reductase iron-sulfur subunit [Parvularcula dongshanensis]